MCGTSTSIDTLQILCSVFRNSENLPILVVFIHHFVEIAKKYHICQHRNSQHVISVGVCDVIDQFRVKLMARAEA